MWPGTFSRLSGGCGSLVVGNCRRGSAQRAYVNLVRGPATNGYPLRRPDWRPNPPNRPGLLGPTSSGTMRSGTPSDLLALVGMKEIDGCSAVADALRLTQGDHSVHRIYKECPAGSDGYANLAAHAIERLDPYRLLVPSREIWLADYGLTSTNRIEYGGPANRLDSVLRSRHLYHVAPDVSQPKRIVQICLHSFHFLHTKNNSARIGGSSDVSGWKHSPIGGS